MQDSLAIECLGQIRKADAEAFKLHREKSEGQPTAERPPRGQLAFSAQPVGIEPRLKRGALVPEDANDKGNPLASNGCFQSHTRTLSRGEEPRLRQFRNALRAIG